MSFRQDIQQRQTDCIITIAHRYFKYQFKFTFLVNTITYYIITASALMNWEKETTDD